jgi:hypothetical protein
MHFLRFVATHLPNICGKLQMWAVSAFYAYINQNGIKRHTKTAVESMSNTGTLIFQF